MKIEKGGRLASGFGNAIIKNEAALSEDTTYEFRLKKTKEAKMYIGVVEESVHQNSKGKMNFELLNEYYLDLQTGNTL